MGAADIHMERIPPATTCVGDKITQLKLFEGMEALQKQDTLFLFDLDSLFGRIGMDRRSICAAPQYCGKDNRMGQISHVHMSILIR
ncbi:hypothetical protein BKD09_43490 [Bradyrhizobium japonicum]|uniref:Uncharacterized protein n=3 Tax=Bradyrhizobium TaxID=374 RepID=A0A837CAW2_9BRAD|nr:hypothetical protein BKD09_43490 [Bradyrhizobium japonicum]KGJ66081.1 hypothetical protein BJA5080_08176 [Bradyrhizobium diazoefficiens SEMIA 5080]KMJ93689.1 hypothetical protein CF64_41690 [Bradyrhizobium japonicum]